MESKTFGKLAALFIMLGAGWIRADDVRPVNIYSYVTPAGKKLTAPTIDHPANYLLISGGYHEAGELVGGEKPPAPEKVEALVQKALSAAHYIDIHLQNNPKQLDYLIVYSWGYMNPKVQDTDSADVDSDDGNVSPTVNMNGAAMMSLVAGDSINRMTPNTIEWEDAMLATEDNRYFVFISAYSPSAYFKDNKKVKKLLWRAQMSLPSDGVTFDKSIKPLVDSSVNYLGRETIRPQQVTVDMDRSGHVEVGTAEVQEYLPATSGPIQTKPGDTPKPVDTQKK
jgi:hypothetical protein